VNAVCIINYDIVFPSYRYLNEVLGYFKQMYLSKSNKVE